MTQAELDRVNAERRQRGLPPLNTRQAYAALESRGIASRDQGDGSVLGSQALDFLVGYSAGIPLPSAGGLAGYMMSEGQSHDGGHSDSGYSGGGGSFGGGGASSSDYSSSSDSSSSSSSSDSGSSSSSSSE